jgi:hypothetical protein
MNLHKSLPSGSFACKVGICVCGENSRCWNRKRGPTKVPLVGAKITITDYKAAAKRLADATVRLQTIAASTEGAADGLRAVSSLNGRQLAIHNQLVRQGDTALFNGRKISLRDLRAIGRVTGDEYSMYRLSGQRLVIRAYINEVKVTPEMAKAIKNGHFGKWAGHTHPPGWSHYPSDVDRAWLPIGQEMSVIYHDGGMTAFFRMLMEDEQFLLRMRRERWLRHFRGEGTR